MNADMICRFWSKVEKGSGKECWVWTASKRNKGYGAFVWADESGKVIQGRAHRFSYELHFTKIPAALCVLHRCDNPSCVNPSHLFLGSKSDNNKDMCSKGRHRPAGSRTPIRECLYPRGTDHPQAKFSETQIKDIRDAINNEVSYSNISSIYGVSISHISRIKNSKVRCSHRKGGENGTESV